MSSSEKRLSILGHVAELRKRLTRSVIAVSITTILSFIFYHQIFDILTYKSPFVKKIFDFLDYRFQLLTPPDVNLVFIDMTENIGTIMKISLVSGIILAMPYLTYELIMFVSPALTRREKRYVYLVLPWIALMFVAGVVFGYFIMLPPMFKFLLSFGSDIATPQIRIGNYVSIVTRLLLVVGLVFEMPVLLTFLARLGIVQAKWLAGKRRAAIIIAFIISAIITPTIDPINQTIVAAPLIILYEMSIWLAKLVQRQKVTKN
ncbi:MAG: twin-arginine translocase subunit TatC [Chloroflexi bacterium]|nr:twin-arginine translocase subunit TatC [Chloroflexota bacterium]